VSLPPARQGRLLAANAIPAQAAFAEVYPITPVWRAKPELLVRRDPFAPQVMSATMAIAVPNWTKFGGVDYGK